MTALVVKQCREFKSTTDDFDWKEVNGCERMMRNLSKVMTK